MKNRADIDFRRRGVLSTLVVAGAALAARTAGGAPRPTAKAPTNPEASAFAAKHKVVPLPFAPGSLNGISERLIVSHHDNNYASAVKNLNRVEQELARINKDTPAFMVAALREKELTFRNSKTLHEAYFANLGGNGKLTGPIETALSQAYGNLNRWEEQFRATGLGLGGGSGWVIVSLELDTGALRTYASANHTQALATSVPILVMDMYEHAYQMDFGANAANYVETFFKNIKADEVNRRFESARRAFAALTTTGS